MTYAVISSPLTYTIGAAVILSLDDDDDDDDPRVVARPTIAPRVAVIVIIIARRTARVAIPHAHRTSPHVSTTRRARTTHRASPSLVLRTPSSRASSIPGSVVLRIDMQLHLHTRGCLSLGTDAEGMVEGSGMPRDAHARTRLFGFARPSVRVTHTHIEKVKNEREGRTGTR